MILLTSFVSILKHQFIFSPLNKVQNMKKLGFLVYYKLYPIAYRMLLFFTIPIDGRKTGASSTQINLYLIEYVCDFRSFLEVLKIKILTYYLE